jgi:murein DD-endopeptidase MepM/ murein hydrolase activator NlpD
MEIANRSSYYNSIYSAIVVNANYNEDPEGKGRVQIYIPGIHYDYGDIYVDYMNAEDKAQFEEHRNKFPWAVTLVENLENGSLVFGSFIGNENNNYIIIGLDVNKSITGIGAVQSGMTISGISSGIIDITMPIILQNEIGLPTNYWEDKIPASYYGKITPSDAGEGWSIGLLQWHHARAYSCLYEIAKVYPDWKKCFTDQDLDLVKDLDASLRACTDATHRTKYQYAFKPMPGTAVYQGIYNMLTSDRGQEVQRNIAKLDTLETINMLIEAPNNITNPAIVIYLTDLINQYGPGLPNTIKEASKISKTNDDIMVQLDTFISYIKVNIKTYYDYVGRRDRVYSYIKELNNQGKLNDATLYDLTNVSANNITGTGIYAHPCPDITRVTAPYGKYPTSGKPHYGIDYGCPQGTKLYACTSGTVVCQTIVDYNTYNSEVKGSYGKYIILHADDGNRIYYAHLSGFNVRTGQRVTKGDLIGYSGNTGNSSGPHLHFEIRLPGGSYPTNTTDPMPYLRK